MKVISSAETLSLTLKCRYKYILKIDLIKVTEETFNINLNIK